MSKYKLYKQSLKGRICRTTSIGLFVFGASTVIIMTLIFYGILSKWYYKQADNWIESLPSSILPHLVDSDHFSIESKMKLIESTGLFSELLIYDTRGNVIAKFPKKENITTHKSGEIFPIKDVAYQIWGGYSYKIDLSPLRYRMTIITLVIIFVLCVLTIVFNRLINKFLDKELGSFNKFLRYIKGLTETISQVDSPLKLNKLSNELRYSTKMEESELIENMAKGLIQEIVTLQSRLVDFVKNEEKVAFQEKVSMVAAQVAHDIRSPLAALNILVSNIEAIPEDERILLRNSARRIGDIANNLSLMKYEKKDSNKVIIEEKKMSIELLSSILEGIVSEKRTQYRDRSGIAIEDAFDQSSYGAFAEIESIEFKRVISNIINNAVEACHEKGTIAISLSAEESMSVLTMQDNGKGIPRDIIHKVCDRNFSFGKKEGSGLGLFHARQTLERWGGTLVIDSEEGRGTKLTLSFPRASHPAWFLPKLTLMEGMMVLVLDDDSSIHEVWKARFRERDCNRDNVMHMHFNSGKAVKNIFMTQKWPWYLLLSDYELMGEHETGLDLIEKLGIGTHAILVTSHFEEANIRSRCERLGVKLLPKGLAGTVPIEILPNPIYQEAESNFNEISQV